VLVLAPVVGGSEREGMRGAPASTPGIIYSDTAPLLLRPLTVARWVPRMLSLDMASWRWSETARGGRERAGRVGGGGSGHLRLGFGRLGGGVMGGLAGGEKVLNRSK
jgi:hypothetical protein